MPLFKPAEQLSDVRGRIQEILEHCRNEKSTLGYFAALYTKVAKGIEAAIEKKEFDDNERLARMDVNFVNYYIHAMNCAFSGEPAPAHWQVAIDYSKKPEPLVLEHLFLAMNAHINYDLSNAINVSVKPEEIIGFKNDFLKVNYILFSLLDNVQNDVADFVWPLKVYLLFGRKTDDRLLSFGMKLMRNDAFSFSCILALCDEKYRAIENANHMNEVVDLGEKLVTHKKAWIKAVFRIVRQFERGSVVSRIDMLLK